MIRHFVSFLVLGMCFTQVMPAQVDDPVPEPIAHSGIVLQVRDFASVIPTSSVEPRARINMLRECTDGSGRLFLNDLNGFLWSIDGDDQHLFLPLKQLFDDFIPSPGKGTGFGAFAFHPEFGENGIFYTSHAEQLNGTADFTTTEGGSLMQWVLTEWTASNPGADVFEGISREVLRWDFPHELHGVQEISFHPGISPDHPDYGLLFICMGDGGSSLHFENANIQNTGSHMGTIWRIDPLGNNSANGNYGIPADNPFADGDEGTLDEIWVYGFRNPHRIAWDNTSERMYVGDIGEMNIEEVNAIHPGNNYGWPEREGIWLYNRALGREHVYPLPADDTLFNFSYPVAMYDHDEGFAIVLGQVYRGEALPELKGKLICGDIVTGRLFLTDADALVEGEQQLFTELFLVNENLEPVTLLSFMQGSRADLRFGNDADGELYILTKADGKVRTLHSLTTAVADPPGDRDGIAISPNPASEKLNVLVPGHQITGVRLISSNGIGYLYRIGETGGEQRMIDVTGCHADTYIVLVETEQGIFTAKCVIVR